ncbi:hypothetical protein C9F11_02635 [Streptomyces sp. YIM 121038]|nr:hypothetical protein C9F11_02635 [Streptomyces sp. YIM 121038]
MGNCRGGQGLLDFARTAQRRRLGGARRPGRSGARAVLLDTRSELTDRSQRQPKRRSTSAENSSSVSTASPF